MSEEKLCARWVDWTSQADVCGPGPSGLETAQRCFALCTSHACRPAFLPISKCDGLELGFCFTYILTTNKKQCVVVWVCIATKSYAS